MKDNYFFTSESVTQGHPDKLCDYISDSLLDAYLEKDKYARVAIETFASKNTIVIAGQVTSNININIENIVRKKLEEIGFDNEELDMDYRTCKIYTNITKQSPDIALGVNIGGAGDQGIMFGYACDETSAYMPYAIYMAHKLAEKLEYVRKKLEIPYLRPDGKTQVTVEYENDKPKRIEAILISTQHLKSIEHDKIEKDIIGKVINTTISQNMIDKDTKIYINPTGEFTIGGPLADTGLTGRKIIVDTYGGYARSGGGAFSGKDATKVDRSASYMLRHIAKNIVANKIARKCEIQISYAIGRKEPISIYVNTFGTSDRTNNEIVQIINKNFSLSPNAIIDYLNLRTPIYSQTTNYGHFGKENMTWEKIIKL